MIEHTLHSTSQVFPEIIILGTLCVIIIADLLVKKNENHISGWILAGGLILSGVAVFMQAGSNGAAFYDMIAVDPFSMFFKALILISSLFIVLFSMNSKELEVYSSRYGEYYMLLAGMVLGMLLMAGATNVLMIYLAFEMVSISSYVLVGFRKKTRQSSEASLKYIIYGAVSSGVMLYGISLLVGVTGATDIYQLQSALAAETLDFSILNISILMIIVGMGFKIALVPFHFWAPDVYEGAPVTITALLAVASKIAAFGLFIRFFAVSFIDSAGLSVTGTWQIADGFHWDLLLGIMAALAMIVGNLIALKQDNIKRMLAYSSIAHAGYITMGLVVLTGEGIASIMIYLSIYMFMNLGAFYVVMLFSNKLESESIEDYKGLGFKAPLESVALTIFLVSLTGLPPTGGFVAKLYIFGAAISGGWIWLVSIAGLTTIISLFYYIRVVRNMFFYKTDGEETDLNFSLPSKAILLALLVPVLFLGIYFEPLIEFAKSSLKMFGG